MKNRKCYEKTLKHKTFHELKCTKKVPPSTDSFLPFVARMVPRKGLIRQQVPIKWTLTGMWAKPFSLSEFSLSVWIWSPSSDQVFDQSIRLSQSATSNFRIIDRHREKIISIGFLRVKILFWRKIINSYKNGNFWGS